MGQTPYKIRAQLERRRQSQSCEVCEVTAHRANQSSAASPGAARGLPGQPGGNTSFTKCISTVTRARAWRENTSERETTRDGSTVNERTRTRLESEHEMEHGIRSMGGLSVFLPILWEYAPTAMALAQIGLQFYALGAFSNTHSSWTGSMPFSVATLLLTFALDAVCGVMACIYAARYLGNDIVSSSTQEHDERLKNQYKWMRQSIKCDHLLSSIMGSGPHRPSVHSMHSSAMIFTLPHERFTLVSAASKSSFHAPPAQPDVQTRGSTLSQLSIKEDASNEGDSSLASSVGVEASRKSRPVAAQNEQSASLAPLVVAQGETEPSGFKEGEESPSLTLTEQSVSPPLLSQPAQWCDIPPRWSVLPGQQPAPETNSIRHRVQQAASEMKSFISDWMAQNSTMMSNTGRRATARTPILPWRAGMALSELTLLILLVGWFPPYSTSCIPQSTWSTRCSSRSASHAYTTGHAS